MNSRMQKAKERNAKSASQRNAMQRAPVRKSFPPFHSTVLIAFNLPFSECGGFFLLFFLKEDGEKENVLETEIKTDYI